MSLTKPLIGVPCFHDRASSYSKPPANAQIDTYLTAISQAGGIPFLIPLHLDQTDLRQLYNLSAGLLHTGGGDIDPPFYQQTAQTKLYSVQPDRDQVEITLSRWAANEQKPTLAICRGIQVMAVAAGGSLYQDLPTQMPTASLHNYVYQADGTNPDSHLVHEVELSPASQVADIFQSTRFWVNSLHHQAVSHVPASLRVVGHSTDGVIEAIENPDHPFFCGVQWHPELIIQRPESPRIFEAFVKMCREVAVLQS